MIVHVQIEVISVPVLPQEKRGYEKVGEATEVALKVLAEKLNVQALDREGLTPSEKATACLKAVEKQFNKVCVCACVCVCYSLLCSCSPI